MQIKQVLDAHPELREDLFVRGFLVTDRADLQIEDFPFYGAWHSREMAGMHFLWHGKTGAHFLEHDRASLFLFGHAYNPFTMQADEQEILAYLASAAKEDFEDRLDELTGIFVLGVIADGALTFYTDPSGIQSACRGVINGRFYLASHAQLIGDVCGLEMDGYVKELIGYKWYGRVMGPYLPADLTPFADLYRVLPNQAYCYQNGSVSHKRFYPVRELPMHTTKQQYEQAVARAADILHRNMQLVAKKWKRPQISLTGGIDSNTTFAAANGLYDRLQTFSYLAAEKESPDCEAARQISEHFSVPWTLYTVPGDNAEIPLFGEKKAVLMHNNGYVAATPDHELRKRMVLKEQLGCDVEVKSWVSETVRAYWYKHFGRNHMPGLSAKTYRNLYKIFLTNRSLARRTDKVMARYLTAYEYASIPAGYQPADMHFWEMTWGSWGSLNISEMKYYADITIIYNNRKFLDLMLGVPLEKRISDEHHLDIKKILNKELWDMGIRVVNVHETKTRAFLLNVIFTLNSHLPF